jgi:hypothetical protein
MSIFDKTLLDELVRLAQIQNPMTGTNPNFAGPETAPRVTPQTLNEIAKKLVTNLQQELAAPQFTAERDNADLRMQAKDLNSLLNFIADNGIAFNGLKIALRNLGNQAATTGAGEGNPELTKLTAEQQALYMTYPYENPRYFVYKNGLMAYLRDLQAKKIPFLDVMVGKLIDQANNELGLKMPAVAPKAEVKLGPDVIVDQIPIPLSAGNAKQWGTDPAGYLSIKELDNFNSPSSFIGSILGKLKYVKSGKTVDLNTIDQGTICEIVNILHARASNYAKTRSDDPRYAAYLNAVNNIASQYSCPVGGGQAPGGGNVKPVSYFTEDGEPTEAAVTALSTLEFPLDPEEINLARIEAFTEKYSEIMGDAPRAQQVGTALANIKSRYNQVTNQNLGRYQVKDVKTDIFNMTGESSPANYINQLYKLLYSTEQMISNLNAKFRRVGGQGAADLKAKLAEQLQYFTRNKQYLDRWMQQLQQDFNNKKQGQ